MAHPAHRLEPVAQETARRDSYARRRPETTVLYQTIEAHWPAFVERIEQHSGLPKFVRDEFDAYLRCGRVECGCLELQCRSCGHSQLVAFSCKRRGFCPACLGRRMSDIPQAFCRPSVARALGPSSSPGGRGVARGAGPTLGVHLSVGSASRARLRQGTVSGGGERVRQGAVALAEAPGQETARARERRPGADGFGGGGAAHGFSPPTQCAHPPCAPEPAAGDQLELGFGSGGNASAPAPRLGRSRWGWLLA
ncbi:MAG: transposase zinc-binding domain-containing protein, partial [Polyangiaceae bacterium]|nr:transposase zinc-binding domain-containing protein [Polyangiaceae bacterium]